MKLMTVGELKALLDDYGDHIPVVIEDAQAHIRTITGVKDQELEQGTTVTINLGGILN